jgi:hypothetical protein
MRVAICIATFLVASNGLAAAIQIGGIQPPNTIKIQGVFTDITDASTWRVKSPTGPNPFPNDGYQQLNPTNINDFPPPHWVLPPFYVDRTEAAFWWRPAAAFPDFAKVDVSEFVAAGDTTLTMQVPSDASSPYPWEVITWESPNLGVVTRTYFRTPEPASAALLALGSLALHRLARRLRRQ